MRAGRQRCDKCNGKGGWVKILAFGIQVFVPCKQCAGKGSWWPNNSKPLKAKAER